MQHINKTFLTISLLIISNCFGQGSSNLSSSPYSLYGLGVTNYFNTGKTNALGYNGFAIPSKNSINNTNPASLAGLSSNTFLYDIGFSLQYEKVHEGGSSEERMNSNFSNLAIAFPINNKVKLGLTLIPYTNVGYHVLGIENQINGSTGSFYSNIKGTGGLNDFQINLAYSLFKNLDLGFRMSTLFGTIKEEETNLIESQQLTITRESFYRNIRFNFGLNYTVNNNLRFGGIINLPATLNASQSLTLETETELNEEDRDIENFKLPLELGFGVYYNMKNKIFLNADFKHNFWSKTNQSDNIGNFVDQYFISGGIEYIPNSRSLSYWKRVSYRAGFSFDNGNLTINNQRINNTSFSLGLGIPIHRIKQSKINIGYSYGKKGTITNGLIQENFHSLTLNLSFADLWFRKRKID